jgi:hypothetical protein
MKSIILYDFEVQNLQKNGKGQIRRVCKEQPPNDSYKLGREISGKYDGKLFWYNPDGFFAEAQHFTCPFGAAGEEIWCKETWGIWQRGDSTPGGLPYDPTYIYQATDDNPDIPESAIVEPFCWKSSITMPQSASRLTIIPELIWTERVQEITRSEIRHEGMICPKELCSDDVLPNYKTWLLEEFMKIWDFHAKPGYKFADNPMIFAAEVKVE